MPTPTAKTSRNKRRTARHAKRKNHPSGEPDLVVRSGDQILIFQYKQPGDSIGIHYNNQLEAAEALSAGLPFMAVVRFQKVSGLTLDRIKHLARLSEGSFARRKQAGRLSIDESERLLRLSRIFERATTLYEGDQRAARQWLETPIPSLADQRPFDLALTEPGAREVEDLIGRIEYGIVS